MQTQTHTHIDLVPFFMEIYTNNVIKYSHNGGFIVISLLVQIIRNIIFQENVEIVFFTLYIC